VPAPLRVLQVISSVSPLRGGPSVTVRNIAEALQRRGMQVDVATTDDDGEEHRLAVPIDTFCAFHGGQRVRYFPRQVRRYCASYPLLRWLKRAVRDYDVVHTHGLFSFAPIAAAWQARAARVPYIMRPAGVLDSWGMRNKSARVKRLSILLLEEALLNQAAAVHFMSDLERRRAAHLGILMRSVVLPLGFDFTGAEGEAGPATAEDLAAAGKPVILFLSRIHPVKRVDVLLRAFARLRQRESAVLAIAGDGEALLLERLKALAGELGIGDSVRWLGFAGAERKRRLFAAATLFVLPSASENFGVAIIEAMDAGLPVVVTEGAGLAEFVLSSDGGIVSDESVESLEAALARLLSDSALRESMGHAGRHAVRTQLSLDAFGTRLESLYRAVVSAAAERAGGIWAGSIPP
jgi:glycosyltransferase involved in cell wall biosynthesis